MPEKARGGLPPSEFGPELRRVREGREVTQKQLGDGAGIHPNTVAKLERGEMEPSWQMVLALSKALGVECTAFVPGVSPASDAEAATAPGRKPAPKRRTRR